MFGTLCPTNENENNLNGLAREIFDFPWGKWIAGDYSWEYGNAIQEVSRRANYNANKTGFHIPGFSTYATDDVEQIINAYGNSVLDGTIPEYNDRGSAAEKNLIYDVVAQRSNMNRDLVRVVLFELYWAVEGTPPTLLNDMVLRPKKFNDNQEAGHQGTPKTARGGESFWDNLRDNGKTLITLAIIGAGAYVLTKVSGAVKVAKAVKQ